MSDTFYPCRLLFNNTPLSANIAVTPAPVGGMEAGNLAFADRTKLCGVNGNTMEIKYQMTTGAFIQAIVITGFDFPLETTFRVRANDTDTWATPNYDSGEQDIHIPAYGAGVGFAGEYPSGGYIDNSKYPFWRPSRTFYLSEITQDEFIKIDITAPVGTASISTGIVAPCEVFQMALNFDYDWKIVSVDNTPRLTTSTGDETAGLLGSAGKRLTLPFTNVQDYDRARLENTLTTIRTQQTPFCLDMFPESDDAGAQFHTLWGTIKKHIEFKKLGHNTTGFTMSFAEQIGGN